MPSFVDLLTPPIDERSPEPLYRQLYVTLRDAILSGRLRGRLPSTRRLAQNLGISRNSVATAYDLLYAEGYLCTRIGAGSFVAENLPILPFPAANRVPAYPETIDPTRLSRWGGQLAVETEKALPDRPFALTAGAFADFPWMVWSRLLARQWRRPTSTLTMHPDAAGLPDLRRAVAAMLGVSRAIRCAPDQILITNGSQQAIDIACRLLLDPGDRVMVEDPGFRAIDSTVTASGGRVVPQPVDTQGLVVPASLSGIRMAVVTPSRNFPLGTTLSLPRRLALLQTMAAERGWIVEDDFDSEFRYDGRPLATLFELDRDRQVLYAGTFTRTLFPGLRLGYLVVPEALIGAARAVRSASDRGVGAVAQAALAAFIEEGHYGTHVRRQKMRLAAARHVLATALTERLSDRLEIVPADGGLWLTALFRGPTDDRKAAAQLAKAGIAVRPLSNFYRGAGARNGLVLTFAGWSEQALREAAARMGEVLVAGA